MLFVEVAMHVSPIALLTKRSEASVSVPCIPRDEEQVWEQVVVLVWLWGLDMQSATVGVKHAV